MSRKRPERDKKREARAAVKAEEEKPKTFRDSWEYRSGKFVLRCAAVLVFLGYLGLTLKAPYTWAYSKWAQSYKTAEIGPKADYYLNKIYKPEKLFQLISARPFAETDELIKVLEPYTARQSSFNFLIFSIRMKRLSQEALANGNEAEAKAKLNEAVFWWQFARFRARYDALRCGSAASVETLNDLLQVVPHPEFTEEEQKDDKALISSIKRVLDLDARYPAENLPEDMCDPLRALEEGNYATVGMHRWADIRYTLRLITEIRLKQMEEEVRTGKKIIPERDENMPSIQQYLKQLKNLQEQPHPKGDAPPKDNEDKK